MPPYSCRGSDEISGWDHQKCLTAWTELTGTAPGSRLSAQFLRRALVFEAQDKAFGGHSAAIKRVLRAEVSEHKRAKTTQPLNLGTQLVREWNGRVYRVEVTKDGFELDGQIYTSLTAIAKRITGAAWSGPRFFGLKRASR